MAKKPVSDQMELFEDGGFKDQGNTKDPISNNPVPVGSTKKEVRDDIPANLSEGEFVLPADVVRYHGLEKIMGFRDQAKQGLQKMEDMGQMGNSDQATLPDGTPFQQMAEGGAVPVPTIQQPEVVAQNQIPGVQYVAPTTQAVRPSIYSFNQQMPQVTVPTQPSVTVPTQPNYQTPAYRQSTSTAETPTFSNLLGTQFGQLQESVTKRYVNDAGEEMYIPFVNGEPIYPIPNGFREEAEDAIKKEDEDINKAVQSTSVRQQQDDGDSGGFDGSQTQDYKVAMQLASYNDNEKAYKDKSLIGQLMSSASSLIEKLPGKQIIDKLTPEYQRQAGFNFPADETEATALTENKKDPSYLDLLARQSGYSSLADMTKQYGVEPTFKFGTKPGDVSLVTGKPYNFAGQSSTPDGGPTFASWDDWVNNLDASRESGWAGGTITVAELDAAEKAHNDRVARGVQGYYGKFDRTKAEKHMKVLEEKYGKKDDDDKDKSKVKTTITSPIVQSKTFDPKMKPDDIVAKTAPKTIEQQISDERKQRRQQTAMTTKSLGQVSNYNIEQDNYGGTSPIGGPSGLDVSSSFDTSSDDGTSENTSDTSYGGEGVGGWTAQGGFINKRTMTMSKTPPNKKKRGGLASRR
jgi:hypothetical protein